MFGAIDILDLKPFEICSTRPPTENSSLTFRLTRNCYWNKCAFCPVYKVGARYSKRDIEEVIGDIRRAKIIDDFMFQRGPGNPVYSEADYGRTLWEPWPHLSQMAGLICLPRIPGLLKMRLIRSH